MSVTRHCGLSQLPRRRFLLCFLPGRVDARTLIHSPAPSGTLPLFPFPFSQWFSDSEFKGFLDTCPFSLILLWLDDVSEISTFFRLQKLFFYLLSIRYTLCIYILHAKLLTSHIRFSDSILYGFYFFPHAFCDFLFILSIVECFFCLICRNNTTVLSSNHSFSNVSLDFLNFKNIF